MKKLHLLTFALAASVISTGAYAKANAQEWVTVGAANKAASSSQAPLIDTSHQAVIVDAEPAPLRQSSSLQEELLWQVQQLQQELAELRGLVEQQEFQINQLQTDSDDRYRDLDQRVAQLFNSGVASKPMAAQTQNNELSPQDAYNQALQLVRDKKYSQASQELDAFVKANPQHELTANALYWSGEVLLVEGSLNDALDRFQRIVKGFPTHNKAPDAMYKAGVTQHRLNNNAEAKVWLRRVVNEYTGKADSIVNLAKSLLERIE